MKYLILMLLVMSCSKTRQYAVTCEGVVTNLDINNLISNKAGSSVIPAESSECSCTVWEATEIDAFGRTSKAVKTSDCVINYRGKYE